MKVQHQAKKAESLIASDTGSMLNTAVVEKPAKQHDYFF